MTLNFTFQSNVKRQQHRNQNCRNCWVWCTQTQYRTFHFKHGTLPLDSASMTGSQSVQGSDGKSLKIRQWLIPMMTHWLHCNQNVYITYSCVVNHLVQDVKFDLCKWQVFTGEISHKVEKKLGMVHHTVQCGNCCGPLTKLSHSLIQTPSYCFQCIQLCLKFLSHTNIMSSINISLKVNHTSTKHPNIIVL